MRDCPRFRPFRWRRCFHGAVVGLAVEEPWVVPVVVDRLGAAEVPHLGVAASLLRRRAGAVRLGQRLPTGTVTLRRSQATA